MKRRFDPATPEWMDRPQPVSAELERDLANIRALNRRFGSHRIVQDFLSRWLKPNGSVRILDLATGSADIPRLIVDWARSHQVSVQIDALDQQASTIEIAQRLSTSYPEITFIVADLFTWSPPLRYDLVLLSLALHHFTEQDAVEILRKCRRLSRGQVLIADLRRTRWLKLSIQLLTTLVYSEPMTKNDARLSAARAFSFDEMAGLAERAGWKGFGHAKFAVGRQAIWLETA